MVLVLKRQIKGIPVLEVVADEQRRDSVMDFLAKYSNQPCRIQFDC